MLHVNVHHLLHNITCLSIWSTDFEVVDHIVSERKGFLAAQSVQLHNLQSQVILIASPLLSKTGTYFQLDN